MLYSPFVTKQIYCSDLGNSSSNRDLVEAIDEIIKAEGPITDELLQIRLSSCWPGQKFTAGRLSKVSQIVTDMLARGGLVQPAKGVLARPGQDLTEVRRADAYRRDRVTHVPPQENSRWPYGASARTPTALTMTSSLSAPQRSSDGNDGERTSTPRSTERFNDCWMTASFKKPATGDSRSWQRDRSEAPGRKGP